MRTKGNNLIKDFIEFLRSVDAEPHDAKSINFTNGKIGRYRQSHDKAGKTNARYGLWDNGGWANGWVINSKEGVKHLWVSKTKSTLSPSEKREAELVIKRQQKEREAQQAKIRARAADKARWVYQHAKPVYGHKYIEKKGIAAHCGREYKGAFVVPLYKDGNLTTVQFIAGDGSKKFLTGGDTVGAYTPLGDFGDVVIVAEGFATGATLFEQLGVPVAVAWYAGNLPSVVNAVRASGRKVIVAADNDESGAGDSWAKKAKADFVVMPENIGTDWNDYYLAYGKDKLKSQFRGVIPERGQVTAHPAGSQNSLPPPSFDWEVEILRDGKGNPVKSSVHNAFLIACNDKSLFGCYCYNEFSHEIVVTKAQPWECDSFHVHRVNDNDYVRLQMYLETLGVHVGKDKVADVVRCVAEQQKIHPAREYFDSLEWDGKQRLDNWLSYYLGAEGDDAKYLSFIGKKWLVAGVKRIYKAGCKFDHILVLESRQGKGKSTALRYLATFGDDVEEAYFTDAVSIADISDKDTIQKVQGSIIIELAELVGMNKKEDEEIKRWITTTEDKCRLPYDKTTSVFQRQFILAGTTNNYEYLRDPTGNRRYWPMHTESIDLEAIKRDRKQLWAEAVHLYKSGFDIAPTQEELVMAEQAQQKRQVTDAWEDDVMSAAKEFYGAFKTADIMKQMGMELKMKDAKAQRRISSVLQTNGYELIPQRVDGKVERLWKKTT